MRDPIKRINSLYWHYAQDRLGKRVNWPKTDIAEYMRTISESAFDCGEINQILPLVYAYETKQSVHNLGGNNCLSSWREHLISPLRSVRYYLRDAVRERMKAGHVESEHGIAKLMAMDFVHIASHVIMFDLECHRVAHADNRMFKMEEMVKSVDYFRNTVWPSVAPHLECTDDYLKDVFTSEKINQHSLIDDSSVDTFQSWSRGFQDALHRIVELLGREEVETMYSCYNYKLPI